jgi:hypothetical protein
VTVPTDQTELHDVVRAKYAAATTTERNASCCSTTAQASCCEPSAKDGCCDTATTSSGGCGCQ